MANVPPSKLYTVAVDECNEIIKLTSSMAATTTKLIDNFQQIIKEVEKLDCDLLNVKEAGVAAGTAGTTLSLVGTVLSPLTAGVSVPLLCGLGSTLTVCSSLTKIASTIAEVSLQKAQLQSIDRMMQNFNSSIGRYKGKHLELEKTLRKCNLSEAELLQNASENERRLYVTKWLTTGRFHSDIEVTESELRKGDHIFRRIMFAPWNFHHGIYIDDETVVELTQIGVKKRTLKDFAERKPLKRRHYNGVDLSPSETEKLTFEALTHPSKYCQYNVLTFNCEHFATFLKVKVQWSGQVDDPLRITSDVFKNIPRTVSAAVDCIDIAAIASSATVATIEIFKMNLTKSRQLSKLSKAAIALGPISVALDITTLMCGYRLTADACYAMVNMLEERKWNFLEHDSKLRFQKKLLTERKHNAELFEQELARLEARRIEEETIENLRCLNKNVSRQSVAAKIPLFLSFFKCFVFDFIYFLILSGYCQYCRSAEFMRRTLGKMILIVIGTLIDMYGFMVKHFRHLIFIFIFVFIIRFMVNNFLLMIFIFIFGFIIRCSVGYM